MDDTTKGPTFSEPCGGCGAKYKSERCIGCLHEHRDPMNPVSFGDETVDDHIAEVRKMVGDDLVDRLHKAGDIGADTTNGFMNLAAEAAARIIAVEAERDEFQQVFDMKWEANQRAIKRWQEANPGNDLVWPDSADLTVWALDRATKAEARIVVLEAALTPFSVEAEAWHPDQPDEVEIYTSKVEPHFGDISNFTLGDLRRARAARTPEPS